MKSLLSASTCLVAILVATAPAAAQTAGDPAGGASTASEPTQDDPAAVADIVVTAQRRSESLQNVPVSVDVVSADVLASRNINSLQQLNIAAPSLQLGQDNTYAVRGVGTLAFQQTVDPAVAVAVDDVNLARVPLSEGVFNDVAQIEVLNGPQGLLFGKNATAGLINITTTRPLLGRRTLDASAEYQNRTRPGSNGQGTIARTALNLPIGDTQAVRLSVAYEYQEPVTRALQTGAGSELDRRAVDARLKYLFEPTDNLTLYAIGNYAQIRGTAGLFDRTYRTLATGSANRAPLAADGFTAGPDLLEYRADGANFRTLNTYGGQLNATLGFGDGFRLINVLAYRGYDLGYAVDLDFTSSNANSRSALNTKYSQISNELRLALPDTGRLSGQVGLFYMGFKDRSITTNAGGLYIPTFVQPNPPFCVRPTPTTACPVANNFVVGSDSDYTFRSDSFAAFSQLTFELTPALRLIAGGRVTRDEVSIDLTQNQLNYFVRFGGPRGVYSQSADNTDFSWKLGGQFQPTRDIMLYGTYAKGYKGPGMNATSATATASLEVRPETSRNIEAGIKTSWFDRRLVANLALFRTRYRDYQAGAFDPVLSAFVVRNAAQLTSKGAEVSLTARPIRDFTLTGTLSFVDSKFDDFPGAQCFPGQGCATFNAAGLRTPLSARFSSSVGASYAIPIGDNKLVLGGDWYHRSTLDFLINNNPLARVGPIDVFGAYATMEVGRGIRLSIFCRNCGDTRVPSFIGQDAGDANARPAPLNSVYQAFGFNAVRTIGGSIGLQF